MKTLFLILVLSIQASAQNFMRYEDLEAGLPRGFQLQSECERGNKECFLADLDKVDEQRVVYDDVDDINKPRYSSAKNITPCADPLACNIIIMNLCQSDELAFYRFLEVSKTYEAYCTKVVGYDKKKQARLTEDNTKRQAKQAKAQEREARRAARASGEARMAQLVGRSDLTAAEAREVALWLLKRELGNE